MPTTITHSIGSGGGRDYSTLQAWEDACPVDLTAVDEIWRGEAYNDSEFYSASAVVLTISGTTTDSTRYLHLTAASGQSFQDNANVRTNLLAYNQANGVGVRTDTSYAANPITNAVAFTRIERLQVKCQTQGQTISGSGGTRTDVRNCFLQNDNVPRCLYQLGSGSLVINCVCYVNNVNTPDAAITGFYGLTVLGCTVVRNPSFTAGGTGVAASSGNFVESTAIFGFTTPLTNNSGSTNNATDAASGAGASSQTSVTFNATTPFVQAGASGTDLRAVAATALAGNGVLDGTNAPTDISLFTRPASPTIGAWQLSGAVTRGLFLPGLLNGDGVGGSFFRNPVG
jgi:hypothetical protein